MKQNKGFTLVELMIVVAIIGILASVAYPTYVQFVKKAQCSDGIDALLSLASRMEEFYLNNDSYATATVADTSSPEGLYTIAITEKSAFTYTISAVPIDSGEKTLTLNSLGQKKTSSAPSGGAECW